MENKENTKIYSFYDDEVFIIDYINTEDVICKIPRLRSIIEHYYMTGLSIREVHDIDIIDMVDTDDLLTYCETGPKSLPNLVSFFLLLKKFQARNFIESVDVTDDFEIHIQLHENVVNEKEKKFEKIAEQIYRQFEFLKKKTNIGQQAPIVEKKSYAQKVDDKKVFIKKPKRKKIK